MKNAVMRRLVVVLVSAPLIGAAVLAAASAHQPYFGNDDLTPLSPWEVGDPTVSYSLYATLAFPGDVDYFAFSARAGTVIPIELLIPQVEGLEAFAPCLALLGPALPEAELPPGIERYGGTGALAFPPPATVPTAFYEPFSRSFYWWRQRARVTIPADGRYVVAVWDGDGATGRYVLALGSREIPGGDPNAATIRARFWTVPPATDAAPVPPAGWGC